MSKAEKRALAYAKSHAHLGYDYDQTYDAVKYGYLQAEKDLALTWEDAVTMVTVAMDVIGEGKITGEENIYTEVLRRFNAKRNEKEI